MTSIGKLLEFPTVNGSKGKITTVQSSRTTPFDVKELYYIYAVKEGKSVASHARRTIQEIYILMSGTLDITLDNGYARERYILEGPDQGLFVPPLTWVDMFNFSPDVICLVLSSGYYDDEENIKDYKLFKKFVEDQYDM